MTKDIVWVLLITISPISELRGGIPLGISLGLDPWFTFFIAVIANALIFFPVFFALRFFYDKLLCRIPLFDKYLDSLRKRGKPKVDKYGFWGLALFVAVPLPLTGSRRAFPIGWSSQDARLHEGENLMAFFFPEVDEGWHHRHNDDDNNNDDEIPIEYVGGNEPAQ